MKTLLIIAGTLVGLVVLLFTVALVLDPILNPPSNNTTAVASIFHVSCRTDLRCNCLACVATNPSAYMRTQCGSIEIRCPSGVLAERVCVRNVPPHGMNTFTADPTGPQAAINEAVRDVIHGTNVCTLDWTAD